MKPKQARSLRSLTCVSFLIVCSNLGAATYIWDADGAAPLNDGGGNWNATGGTNWNTGTTYGPWGNTTADEAIFGAGNGAADTINVGSVTANKLTFNAPGSGNYTLTGGAIALGGTNPTITANANARIDSTISSTTANAFIRGAGTLTLGGTANFTGGQAWEGLYRYVPANSTGGIAVVAGANITAKNLNLMQDNAANCTINYNQTGGTVNVTGSFGLGGSTAGGASGTNTATISGGTLTAADLFLYKWAGSHLHVNSAGTVNATSLRIGWVDSSPTGTINIGDGTNFSGGTTINDGGTSGILKVNSWNIQNNRNYTLNFNGGTLKAGAPGGNWLQAGAFTNARVQDTGGIIDNGGFGITINQVLSHGGVAATDGGLVFNGTGITTLGGNNTYNGATTVNAGTLRITGSLATSAVTVKGGAAFGGTSTSGAVAVANGGTVEGGIGGAGTLTTGNLTLGTTSGDTASLVGTVSSTAGYKPIAVGGDFNANGGADSVSIIVAPAAGLAAGTYDFLTWTGTTNIADGSVFKQVVRSMTPVFDSGNKKVQVTYNSAVSSIYWAGGGSAWNTSATGNWKQTTDNANTTFMQSDTVLFHDTAGSGVVDISNGNVLPVAVTFDNTAAGTAYTLQGANGFSAGTFTKLNDGTVTLTNTNSTTGAVAIHGGTVSFSQTGGLGTGNLSLDGGAMLEYTGASTVWSRNFTVNNVIGTGGGKVSVASAATLSGGTLSGAGALLKTGAGTLAFSGSGGYSGSFTVSQGTLQLNNTGGTSITLGDAITGNENVALISSATNATPITVSAANTGTGTATIGQNNNYTTLSGLITLERATTINTTAGDRAGMTGKITGNVGTLTFSGNRVTLEQTVGNSSDFTGNVIVDCQVQMSTAFGIPATADVQVNAGKYFRTIAGATINGLNGSGTVNNNSGGGAATIPLSLGNDGGGGSFSGTLQNGSGSDIMHLVKSGGGTQELSGSNITYTGATTVNSGTLKLTDATGFNSSSVVMNGGTLEINRTTATQDLTKAIIAGTGAGKLVKSGAGTVTLGGTNTYTGTTDVQEGTLALGAAGSIANSPTIHVASGATLDVIAQSAWSLATGQTLTGNGTLKAGTINVGSNSILAPGSSIGTLNVDGNLTLSGIANFEVDPTNLADLASVSGLLVFGGTLNVIKYGSDSFAANDSFDLFNWGSSSGTFAEVNLPALSGGLAWDQSQLYTTGSITIIPEPSALLLLGLGSLGLGLHRRRDR